MPDQPPPRRSLFAVWRWPRWTCVIAVFLVLAGYPLSIGPVNWLLYNGYIPMEAASVVQIIYTPLGFLAGNSEFITNTLNRYIGLWVPTD